MGITIKINGQPVTNISSVIDKNLKDVEEKLNKRLIMAVRLACLKIVERARNLPSPPANLRSTPHQPYYIDDTTLLRKSIGFCIYNQGTKVAENFESGDGAILGAEVCSQVAALFPNKIIAVIVAGANYAALVESKGYFVLSEPASHLSEELKTYLQQIKI